MADYRLEVEGMSCRGCEAILQERLTQIPGVSAAAPDAERGVVDIYGDPDSRTQVRQTVLDTGYDLAE